MYGQRSTELDAAKAIAQNAGVEHRVINIDLGNLGVLHLQIITLMFQIMNKKVFL
jgi:7-cyano-7-deazaguanine synthase in queuosine biosynthesis